MRQRIGVVLSYWTWDLVSADGETLDSSGPFSSREECCADAARQGLPVSASPYQPGKQSWTISRDQASTTWRWECAEESGAMICRSKQGFVTARECIGNARQSGYVSGIRLA
jgi:hypothetical protein